MRGTQWTTKREKLEGDREDGESSEEAGEPREKWENRTSRGEAGLKGKPKRQQKRTKFVFTEDTSVNKRKDCAEKFHQQSQILNTSVDILEQNQ